MFVGSQLNLNLLCNYWSVFSLRYGPPFHWIAATRREKEVRLSFTLSFFLSFTLSLFLSFSLLVSFSLSLFLSFSLSLFLSFSLSLFLSVSLSLCLSFSLSLFLSFSLSTFLPFYLSIILFLSFSQCYFPPCCLLYLLYFNVSSFNLLQSFHVVSLLLSLFISTLYLTSFVAQKNKQVIATFLQLVGHLRFTDNIYNSLLETHYFAVVRYDVKTLLLMFYSYLNYFYYEDEDFKKRIYFQCEP
jgi:hypothetical protein